MSEVTRIVVGAFVEGRPARRGNTRTDGVSLWLHGNLIAKRHGAHGEHVWITLAGHPTRATRTRLNAIPGVDVYQRNRRQYVDGTGAGYYIRWDGSWVKVSTPLPIPTPTT